ncbi:MAG: hypothetical protein Q4D79_03325 [Propionibacteriaceae bacterium]|nr:hypothetical protein [Propionibacteriaceae bacterium]
MLTRGRKVVHNHRQLLPSCWLRDERVLPDFRAVSQLQLLFGEFRLEALLLREGLGDLLAHLPGPVLRDENPHSPPLCPQIVAFSEGSVIALTNLDQRGLGLQLLAGTLDGFVP